MSDNIFTDEDKGNIVALMREFIKNNGYVSVRWACQEHYKKEYGFKDQKEWVDDEHRKAFIKSVSGKMINTGEYIRELAREDEIKKHGFDYDIVLNPAYFINKSVKTTSRWTMWLAAVSVAVSAGAFYKQISTPNEISVKELQSQNIQLQKQLLILEQIPPCLAKIDSSILYLQKTGSSNK